MPDPTLVIIEVVGEGKTDIGPATSEAKIELPMVGVVPVLIHRICGEPALMRVKRRKISHLQQGNGLSQKLKFAKRQASYNKGSAGIVCVLDTEGDMKGRLKEMANGLGSVAPDFPFAMGVAHPCIESWLLSDASAIASAMKLPAHPDLPEVPEALPAPQHDEEANPKSVLATCVGSRGSISAGLASKIATLSDLEMMRTRCPLSFDPFALEVEDRIAPIFAG